MVGDSQIGKTSLMVKYVEGESLGFPSALNERGLTFSSSKRELRRGLHSGECSESVSMCFTDLPSPPQTLGMFRAPRPRSTF